MLLSDEVNAFLKPENNKFKKISYVKNYLQQKLSPFYFFEYNLIKDNFTKNYCVNSGIERNISENRILSFFINDNTCLAMPLNKALSIPCIKNIISEDFQEKPVKFKYYDPKLKHVFNGPIIIILTLPIDSIILDNSPLRDNLSS